MARSNILTARAGWTNAKFATTAEINAKPTQSHTVGLTNNIASVSMRADTVPHAGLNQATVTQPIRLPNSASWTLANESNPIIERKSEQC